MVRGSVLAMLLLLGCRREAAVKKLTEADGKPRRVTCTLPSEEPITVDVTVPARCDLSIEKPRTFTAGRLTLEAGAHLSLASGAFLRFSDHGNLVARGTAAEPILIDASPTGKPGEHDGLLFDEGPPGAKPTAPPALPPLGSPSTAPPPPPSLEQVLVLDHVVLRHAGARDQPAIDFQRNGAIELGHVTIAHATRALRVAPRFRGSGASLRRFTENVIEGTLEVQPAQVAELGEGVAQVTVLGGAIEAVTSWPKRDYLVVGTLFVGSPKAPASLTLAAGSTLRFRAPFGLEVSRGALIAKGVTFDAEDAARGFRGIGLHFDVAGTTLEGCTVKNVRGPSAFGPRAALAVQDDKGVHITRVTFDKNDAAGIEADDCALFEAKGLGNSSIGQPLCVPGALSLGSLAVLGALSVSSTSALAKAGADPSPFEIGTLAAPGPAAPPKPAQVIETGATVTGKLPTEVVRAVVRKNVPRVRACYQAGLAKDPTLAGTLTVNYVIDPKGAVISASVTGLSDAGVTGCVQSVFKTLGFPDPESGNVVVVHTLGVAPP